MQGRTLSGRDTRPGTSLDINHQQMTRKNDRKRKLAKAGPVRPPSTWPLDHIPEPVLDIIIEYLADSARDFQPGGASSVFRTTCLGSDPVVPLTSDLKNLSMVNAHIRQMVMAKHIAHTVVLGSAWHIFETKESLRPQTLGSIRSDNRLAISTVPN
jgi:hypothetical protein